MKKINCAIIGFGKMGKIRYETIQRINDVSVSKIYETNQECEIPAGVTRVSDVDEIMTDASIDAVVVSTPNNYIKDLVVRSLAQGKHVFAEKPPGRSLKELNEMIAAEQSSQGCKLMFGFNHRHHESMVKAKELIASGEYGKILWMRGRYGKSVNKAFFDSWRSKKELAGGGIFLDQGIHMLDLFLMMAGNFDEVQAYVSNCYWKLDIEDNVFAIFRNKEGQVASLHSTMTQWRHLFSFEIFLEKGYIAINGLKTSSNTYGDEVMSVALNRSLPPEATWTEEQEHVFHTDHSWKREMDMFAAAIRKNTPVAVGNTSDALKLMTLVDKVYKQGNISSQIMPQELLESKGCCNA